MKLQTSLFLLGLLSLSLAGEVGWGAPNAPVPPVVKPAPGSAPDSFNLELQRIGGELMVQMQDLFVVIHKLDPAAGLHWDPASKIMQIESEGNRLDVLTQQPAVLINNKPRTVAHPILMRQDKVYIPVETVQILLNEMGIEFDLLGGAGSVKPTPTPSPAPAAVLAPTLVPAVPTTSALTLAQTAPTTSSTAAVTSALPAEPAVPSSVLAPSDNSTTTVAAVVPANPAAPANPAVSLTPIPGAGPVVAAKINEAPGATEQKSPAAGDQTPLEPPSALSGKIGLTWGQLADMAHHSPPRRVTVLYDGPLEAVAQQMRQTLQDDLSIEVVLLPAPSAQRSDETLVGRVQATSPELFIDLLASAAKDSGGEDAPSMAVWAAHEALWPRDQEVKANGDAETLRYRRHQFQSLALGSLLRTELGRQFPNAQILYELAPSYLLRRLDAPAAEVVVPAGAKVEAARAQHLAQAVAAAVEAYIRGMGKVQF